jgi:hypothetical protein
VLVWANRWRGQRFWKKVHEKKSYSCKQAVKAHRVVRRRGSHIF